jgi:hypothetical protein
VACRWKQNCWPYGNRVRENDVMSRSTRLHPGEQSSPIGQLKSSALFRRLADVNRKRFQGQLLN